MLICPAESNRAETGLHEMEKKKPLSSVTSSGHDDSAAVDAIIEKLEPAATTIVEALRTLILKASPHIKEGVKWNSPSFCWNGWFATVNARMKSGVTLVLHHDSSPRPDSDVRTAVADLDEILKWHSADRASISFESIESFNDQETSVKGIVEQWAKYHANLPARVSMKPKQK